jgi:5-methylcytosine-specific restriction endonuclease McrA
MGRDLTPLQRDLKAKRRKTLKAMSDRRQGELASRREIRERVWARDGHRCRFPHHEVPDLPCFGGLTVHHLLKASQGGEYTDENLITICAVGNCWIEDHPRRATELGLVHFR